jgi:hypothetical protein
VNDKPKTGFEAWLDSQVAAVQQQLGGHQTRVVHQDSGHERDYRPSRVEAAALIQAPVVQPEEPIQVSPNEAPANGVVPKEPVILAPVTLVQ